MVLKSCTVGLHIQETEMTQKVCIMEYGGWSGPKCLGRFFVPVRPYSLVRSNCLICRVKIHL